MIVKTENLNEEKEEDLNYLDEELEEFLMQLIN